MPFTPKDFDPERKRQQDRESEEMLREIDEFLEEDRRQRMEKVLKATEKVIDDFFRNVYLGEPRIGIYVDHIYDRVKYIVDDDYDAYLCFKEYNLLEEVARLYQRAGWRNVKTEIEWGSGKELLVFEK